MTQLVADVFLVGTAMLVFGMSLYVMFVGTNNLKGEGSQHLRPSLFGNFNVEVFDVVDYLALT